MTEVKGILVFEASGYVDCDRPNAATYFMTQKQFDTFTHLCTSEAEGKMEFDCDVLALLAIESDKDRPTAITHYCTLESYYGSYVSHHFSRIKSLCDIE